MSTSSLPRHSSSAKEHVEDIRMHALRSSHSTHVVQVFARVVTTPLLIIGKYLVCLVDVLELGLCLLSFRLRTGVLIRMPLKRHLAIRLFKIPIRSVLADSEDLVIILSLRLLFGKLGLVETLPDLTVAPIEFAGSLKISHSPSVILKFLVARGPPKVSLEVLRLILYDSMEVFDGLFVFAEPHVRSRTIGENRDIKRLVVRVTLECLSIGCDSFRIIP
mmetsp:Transcript_24171/g.38067  ORF Transcript_24171/g.38067 Transcript_24171/m.38067 type:complete len:219 (-) Transcript_24171:943-1599(-)